MYILGIVVIIVLLLGAYIRLAPTDITRWHQPIDATANKMLKGGAIRVLSADRAGFEDVDQSMRALPRTQVLAGSLDDGRITYVTRSTFWGFPDYTTVQYADGTLKLFGRLRFGRSDFGVNAVRLTAVLLKVQ